MVLHLEDQGSMRSPGTIAIAYGFIADIAPPAERGSYVGILQGL